MVIDNGLLIACLRLLTNDDIGLACFFLDDIDIVQICQDHTDLRVSSQDLVGLFLVSNQNRDIVVRVFLLQGMENFASNVASGTGSIDWWLDSDARYGTLCTTKEG